VAGLQSTIKEREFLLQGSGTRVTKRLRLFPVSSAIWARISGYLISAIS
jgi:hypothetical protein